MRRLCKPIEVIAYFDNEGNIRPARFRMDSEGGEMMVITIGQILKIDEQKLAGNRMKVFDCTSQINDRKKNFQIRYELSTCRWYLYKM